MPPMAAHGYGGVRVGRAECSAREYFKKSKSLCWELAEGVTSQNQRPPGSLYSRAYRKQGMRWR